MHFLRIEPDLDDARLDAIEDAADALGAIASHLPTPVDHLMTVVGADAAAVAQLAELPGVVEPVELDPTWPLVSRARYPDRQPVELDGVSFGGDAFVVAAGPCSVERREQVFAAADAVRRAGASLLRGGAYKPRTSPYDFQGLGVEGLRLLAHAGHAHGLPIVTEAMAPADVDGMVEYVDMFQVGARNMQNYALLKALADQPRPVLLKRGPGANFKEWLLAAEYIVTGGNEGVVLCERGIRSFETANRYTLDLASAVLAQQKTWLPVIIDPSHATGRPELIPAMSMAGLAAGLDGLIVEVHAHPDEALSDGPQALVPTAFDSMMDDLRRLAPAVGRTIAPRIDAAPTREAS